MSNYLACLKVPLRERYSLRVCSRHWLIVGRRRHGGPESSAPGEMFQHALRRYNIVLGNPVDQLVSCFARHILLKTYCIR